MSRPALQRCEHHVPGLRSRPWWPAQDVPHAAVLEAHSDAIASEFADLVLAGRLRLHPQSHSASRKRLTVGDWNVFELWTHGRPHLGNLVEAPVTADVLDSMPDATGNTRGNSFFSVLQPGVHVQAHCGPTNTRIRLHLGLHVPPGATMRVGTETRTWEEGRCLVFDDSWEHEAGNPSDRPRSILLVDIWHPDLAATYRETLGNGGPPDTMATWGERGWVRRQDERSAASVDPIDPAMFAALDPRRVARIRAAARKARALELPAVAEAAGRVLRVLAAGADDETPGDGPGTTDDVIWAELAQLADDAVEHGLKPADVLDLAHVCSISWRTWPGNANAMIDFLAAWPPADKAECADRLVALGTLARMITALGELGTPIGQPPFGALVPVLCAAHRRSLAGSLLQTNG
jgi:hypothetical protein